MNIHLKYVTLVAMGWNINYTLTINPNGGELNGSTENQNRRGNIQKHKRNRNTNSTKKDIQVTLNNNDGTETTNK